MGGQSMQRRDALRVLALAGAASQFTGFERWVYAHDHQHARKPAEAGPAKPYEPRFFTAAEYPAIARLVEVIIPSDGSPGAKEAGVAEFVDFMAFSDDEIKPGFRGGLAWLEARARRDGGKGVAELDDAALAALLEPLAYSAKYAKGDEEGQAFFRLVRQFAVMGFYSSRVGMESLDNPFLKEYYPALPGCPHKDDRRHERLPKG